MITDTGEETSALATVPPPRSTVAPASGSEPAPQSTGATYYVGRHSCNDAGPGSEAHPFCSIGIALAALRPGDTLVILKGTYTNRLVVNSIAGTGNAPITIRGESAESVVFDGGCPGFPCGVNDVSGEWDDDEMGMVMLTDSSHFVLRDLTVQNVIAVGVAVMGGNDIWVENITIHGTGHAGMLFKYLSGLTVAGNDIGFIQHGWKDENDDVQVGAHESLSVVGVEDFTVRDNTVHDSLKEGIDIKESATNGEATNNFVERTCLVGIYINEAQQVTVRDNQVRAAGYFLTGDGEEDLCRNQPTFGDLYGRYYGGGIQVAVGDLGDLSTGRLSDLILVRNVVWNSVGNGLEFWDELEESGQGDGTMTDIQVHNNVFYNTTFAGIRLEDAQNVTIANNILMLNAEAPLTGDMVGSSTLSHNLFFPVEGTAGNHPVTVDPLFVNPVGGDFHLQPDSPAIDAGLDVGLPYTGNAPDMGAYEFSAGGSETRSDGAVRLTTPPAGGSDQNPAFAPDDSQMVFTRFDNGYND
ncbi:MAG: right-handed parallel beta-helix repeat-containing protein, partial [Anaerolineae bacterium]